MLSFFKKKKVIVTQKEHPIKETENFTDITLVAEYFKNETGITFLNQMDILKNKVSGFCRHREIYSFTRLIQIIKSDTILKQELIDYLTTNETYFYREFKQITDLTTFVKKENSSVKILCAPCATGEEPYSIAIALLEAGVPANSFQIVGIDINSDALQRSAHASYGERNIRNLSPAIINKYFSQDNSKYLLKNSVKSLVTFKLVNIFDDSFKNLGKFDFIFSRNMLIYFDKETTLKAKAILEKMRKNEKYNVFFGHADLF